MLGAVQAAYGPLERCADPAGEVAKNFRVPGFQGTVSFITSMTKAFCSGVCVCRAVDSTCCFVSCSSGGQSLYSFITSMTKAFCLGAAMGHVYLD